MTSRRLQRIAHAFKMLAIVWVFATPSTPFAQDVVRIDEVLRYHADESEFMGSVLITQDDRILLDKGYGFANIEWKAPNSPTTKFRIGSITKQFTAAAVLLLEERGLLSLDDRVSMHLTAAPSAWSEITVFHLLAHRSGIPELLELPDAATWRRLPALPAQTTARLVDLPLEFEPGTQAKHTDSGYLVAGYLHVAVARGGRIVFDDPRSAQMATRIVRGRAVVVPIP